MVCETERKAAPLMRYLVVGGHARGIGKTALVVDVIRAFPEAGWTAVKISPHGHGAWPGPGEPREGGAAGAAALLEEETECRGRSDSSRYLAAGALRSFWLRTRQGHLAAGLAKLEKALRGDENLIIESNAVLEVVRPQLCLMVLDPSVSEFKESARRWLGCADAFVTRGPLKGVCWQGVSDQIPESKPVFEQRMGEPLPEGLLVLIRNRLFTSVHPPTT